MTDLRIEKCIIPGARLEGENPLPFFRSPQPDPPINTLASLPTEKQAYLGWETGFRVLPYRMQDQYSRQREALEFKSVVLENQYLTATFLPELGGRLISLVYRPLNRELLHRNPVFQPANLAVRNAWFSGGIEWNVGQYGHAFTTCSPVYASIIPSAPDGSLGPGLRLYEFERCKGLFWQIDFYLPPELPFLCAYARVTNPNPYPTSMYYWANTAVNEAQGVRVLSSADTAIYLDFTEAGPAFGSTTLPGLPSLKGEDGTYSLHSPFANEFFFQGDDAPMPWEAALDSAGCGFIEASTPRLKYRKLFCWGNRAGGRHWQEFLSQPGQAYLEIQAGLAPTQLHGLPMPANATWDWTQLFGYVEADPAVAHHPDWPTARRGVESALREKLTPAAIAQIEAACRARARVPGDILLVHGSGWGALERLRLEKAGRAASVPVGLAFPDDSIGPEQEKWLALLNHAALPDQAPEDLPGEWLVQREWLALLEASMRSAQREPTWYALLHLGVMRLEAFDEDGAEAAWQASLQLKPSAWAYRNLAVLALRRKDTASAFNYYQKAWQSGVVSTALAAEYLQSLVEAAQFGPAHDVYQSLPQAIQQTDRVQILYGQIALQLGDLDAVEAVLQREYAVVREGEIVLSDLWDELRARRFAAQSGEELTPALRAKTRALYPPPARIDFRMGSEG